MAQVDRMLHMMKAAGASDLHLKAGMRPRYRINGELRDVEGSAVFTREEVDKMTRELLSEEQDRVYREEGDIDFAYGDVKSGRFRCNYFMEHWGPAAVYRRIPVEIPTLKELNLPPTLETLTHLRGGIVLVTGPTGSGKTSTLASLIDLVNATYRKHIITLEDPIEYLHPSKKSVVHQRGLHYDLTDFPSGLRAALREDPDIILIGEMRDLETIRLALTAAEVGSLVFGTLHTNGASQTVDRIIDVFPGDQQNKIRATLSEALKGVVAQNLFKRVDRKGRVAALEILIFNTAVANLVREGKTHQIPGMIQIGKKYGNTPLDDSIMD
ncbi:MAG TPA: PilT/PilU family type 4a pilus ATPase, partial [Planctomycetota bacterium]|nr:PilT/PilU family type 4a pilus ATPase [Planctomycetota bacterium]